MFFLNFQILVLAFVLLRVNAFREGIPGVDATFDYVVVGGGTSGFTVAARLAEADFTVAMVEAGDFYEVVWPLSKVPGAAVIGIGGSPTSTTPIDWNFITEPVPGANNRSLHYARHKTFGGCSVCNAMIYQRCCVSCTFPGKVD
jgi:choline dehydrogenase